MAGNATDHPTNWRPSIRYEDDSAGWLAEQIALLRGGRLSEIGCTHEAEELDGLSKSS